MADDKTADQSESTADASGGEPAGESAGQAKDVKAKFREALDRKNNRAQSGQAHEDASSKAKAPAGSASHQRTFRRKTG